MSGLDIVSTFERPCGSGDGDRLKVDHYSREVAAKYLYRVGWSSPDEQSRFTLLTEADARALFNWLGAELHRNKS